MICIIPARGGSRRIPMKNIKSFLGKPIIAYSILAARESKLFDQIIVDSDDWKIRFTAEYYGAEVRERPPELAHDDIGTQEVVGAALKDLGVARDTDVCALYATAPFLTASDLRHGYELFTHDENQEYPCVYSADINVEPTGGFYWASAGFFMDHRDPYAEGLALVTSDIDINAPEDWAKAEKLYEEIHGTKQSMGG